MVFNCALEYAIRRVQVNQSGLRLNGTHHFLVYANNDNKLGVNILTVKKNTETLVVASNETGLEVNADKSEYMVMSLDKIAG
jgi:hypothetical protein